jgi:hypothetical protein
VLCTLVIQLFIWYSENILGLIKGVRFPWAANYGWYILFALSCGSVGLWVSLQWARRLRLSPDPYVFYLRAFIIAALLTVALSFANAELPVYFAGMILFLALAVLVRPLWLKGILAVLTVLPPIRLVFFEYLGLFQRGLSGNPSNSALGSLLYNVMFPVIYGLLSLPLVYALAAIYRSGEGDLFFLRRFASRKGLAMAGAAAVVLGLATFLRQPYDATWKPSVRISQIATAGADSGSVTLMSGEYLKGVRVWLDGRDTVLDANVTSARLRTDRAAGIPWLAIEETTMVRAVPGDSLTSLDHTLILKNARRPYMVTVAYRSDRKFEVNSQWSTGGRRVAKDSDRQKTFTWYAFPESTLIIPATFAVRDSQSIHESIEVVYDSLAYPLSAQREGTLMTQRATVTASREFSAKK